MDPQGAPETLIGLINGYQVSQAIHVAAVLRIADLLADGARTSDDLAQAAGADADSLYRLLRALVGRGRTRGEYAALFESAGFRFVGSTAAGELVVFEGEPV